MVHFMIALGFPVTTAQDFRHYVYQASEFGQKIECRNGSYTCWSLGNGIELWVQTNLHKRILGMNAHFSGDARMLVGLTRRIQHCTHSILDGAFYGWAAPNSDMATSGHYPFVFNLPNYDLYDTLHLPQIVTVQLTAFAYELRGFENEASYVASQGRNSDVEAFYPTGLYSHNRDTKEPGEPQARFSGHIQTTAMLINPVTDQRFYWAKVQTLGGDIDIVADPQVLQGKLVKGGVVSGDFWLSGRIM